MYSRLPRSPRLTTSPSPIPLTLLPPSPAPPTSAELEYAEAGKVLLEQRRERLRAVLDSEYNAQVAELAKLGLAIAP